MPFGIDELVLLATVGGSFMQASAEQAALDEKLTWMKDYYAPELAARKNLMGKLGKESPLLAARHKENVRRVQQQEASAKALARGRAERLGTPGAGRYEAARVSASATDLLNKENLEYAQLQQEQLDRTIGALLGRGEAGMAIAGAMGEKGAIGSSLIGDIGTALGGYTGKKSTAELNTAKVDLYKARADQLRREAEEDAAGAGAVVGDEEGAWGPPLPPTKAPASLVPPQRRTIYNTAPPGIGNTSVTPLFELEDEEISPVGRQNPDEMFTPFGRSIWGRGRTSSWSRPQRG